jgi:hypothetical protein
MDPDPRFRYVKEGVNAAQSYVSMFSQPTADCSLTSAQVAELAEAQMDLVSAMRHIEACESLMPNA